ncbi:MAG: endolytic transglycosylase MltG [Bacteroidales bacterium]
MRTKHKNRKKVYIYSILVISTLVALSAWKAYNIIYKPNISITEESYDFIIPNEASVESISKKLEREISVRNISEFKLLAQALNLKDHIYPGLYSLENNMNNKELVQLFRSGKQKTIQIHIPFSRYARDIMQHIAPDIRASQENLMKLLVDNTYIDSLGFNRYTIICMFLQDTYFFHWNTSAKDFFERMHREYHKFWNKTRLQQAQEIGLTPTEIMTLASIVDQETIKNVEKSRIAGVYINRLRKNIPLQADPTVKYAVGDFELKRVRGD